MTSTGLQPVRLFEVVYILNIYISKASIVLQRRGAEMELVQIFVT